MEQFLVDTIRLQRVLKRFAPLWRVQLRVKGEENGLQVLLITFVICIISNIPSKLAKYIRCRDLFYLSFCLDCREAGGHLICTGIWRSGPAIGVHLGDPSYQKA